MATTLKCNDCDNVHVIACPNCHSSNQQVLGSLDLGLLGADVHASITIGSMGTSLLLQKPSGQVIIPLADVDLHTQLKLAI